jgi:hypothetical protein
MEWGGAATRAKALILDTGSFSAGLKARSPGLKSGATPRIGTVKTKVPCATGRGKI